MATRIRLRRMGSNKRPFYRVVVADQRSPRDGRFIEIIGKYHPLNDPSVIEIDADRALHWLMVGAQPSNQVRNLMSKVGIWDRFVAERPSASVSTASKPERPVRTKMSKKAQAKAAEAAERGTEAPTPAPEPESATEAEASSPEPQPKNAATEPAAPATPAGVEPDEAPEADTTGADLQETPEG
jgi:small subunit ribosomal protein S16